MTEVWDFERGTKTSGATMEEEILVPIIILSLYAREFPALLCSESQTKGKMEKRCWKPFTQITRELDFLQTF